MLSVYCSHDGAQVDESTDNFTLHTDWVCIQVQMDIGVDPFAAYMHLTGLYNDVHRLISLEQLPFHHTIHSLKDIEEKICKHEHTLGVIRDAKCNANENEEERGVLGRLPVGWCSWYHYYDHIDEKSLDQVSSTANTYTHPYIYAYMHRYIDTFVQIVRTKTYL